MDHEEGAQRWTQVKDTSRYVAVTLVINKTPHVIELDGTLRWMIDDI